MQWLIDIIQAWVITLGYLTTGYIDRGEAAVFDFDKDDLTADADWHELDLSAIIPENAKLVHITGNINYGVVAKHFAMRHTGYAEWTTINRVQTQVAGVTNFFEFSVKLDSNRKIEYILSDVAWTTVDFSIQGWWL